MNLIQEGAVLLKKDDDAEYLMYLSAHHELVASALAVKAAHEINPDLQVGCMIGMNAVYPASPNPTDVMNALVLLQNIKDVMKKHMIISVRTLF